MDKLTSQPSDDHGKKLMKVGDTPIKFRFARLIHVYKIKKKLKLQVEKE